MGIIQNTQKKLTMPSKAELETIVKKAFELYDADKSGFLEREEIKKLLNDACSELGAPQITDAQLDEVIKSVDENGDNKFSFEELYSVIGPILGKQFEDS